jgi:hypothetical protein
VNCSTKASVCSLNRPPHALFVVALVAGLPAALLSWSEALPAGLFLSLIYMLVLYVRISQYGADRFAPARCGFGSIRPEGGHLLLPVFMAQYIKHGCVCCFTARNKSAINIQIAVLFPGRACFPSGLVYLM